MSENGQYISINCLNIYCEVHGAGEPLPADSSAYDCDGDGWTGSQEMHIYAAATTANDQDSCGNNGWPADLAGTSNKVDIGDLTSFTSPSGLNDGHGTFSYLNHTVPDAGRVNEERWNLDQAGSSAGIINAGQTNASTGDMNAIKAETNSPTARPPMFSGQPAWNKTCPWNP